MICIRAVVLTCKMLLLLFSFLIISINAQLHTCDQFSPLSCSPMVKNITAASWIAGVPVSPVCNCRDGFSGTTCELFQRPCALKEVQTFCDPLYGASCTAVCDWSSPTTCSLLAGSCANRTTRPCVMSEVWSVCGPLGQGCTWNIGVSGSVNASSCNCGADVLDTALRYSPFACVSRHNTSTACPVSRTANISLWAEQCGVAGTLGCAIQVVWLNSAQIAASAGVSVPSTIDGPTVDYKLATFYSGQTLYVWDSMRQQYNVGSYFYGNVPYEFAKCTCAQNEDTFAATLATSTRQQFAEAKFTFSSTSISYQFCDVVRLASVQSSGDWLSTSAWARPVCNGIGVRTLGNRYPLSFAGFSTNIIKTLIDQWWTTNAVGTDSYAYGHKRFIKYSSSNPTINNAGNVYTPETFAWTAGPVPQLTDGTYTLTKSTVAMKYLDSAMTGALGGTITGSPWRPASAPFASTIHFTIRPAVDPLRFLRANNGGRVSVSTLATSQTEITGYGMWYATADPRDDGIVRIFSLGLVLCTDGITLAPTTTWDCASGEQKWYMYMLDDSGVPYMPTRWETQAKPFRVLLWSFHRNVYVCVTSSFGISFSTIVADECLWDLNRVAPNNLTSGFLSIQSQFTGNRWLFNNDYLVTTNVISQVSSSPDPSYMFVMSPLGDKSDDFIMVGANERIVQQQASGEVNVANANQEVSGVGNPNVAWSMQGGTISCNVRSFAASDQARCIKNTVDSPTRGFRNRGNAAYITYGGSTVQYSSSSANSDFRIVPRPGTKLTFSFTIHGGISETTFYPLMTVVPDFSTLSMPANVPKYRNRVSFTPLLHFLYNTSCVCPPGFSGSDCSTLTGATVALAPGLQTLVTAGTDEYTSLSTSVDTGGGVRCSTGGLTSCIARSTSLLSKAGCINGVFNFMSSVCVCDAGWTRNATGFCTTVDTSTPSNCGGRNCAANGGTCSSTTFGTCNCTLSGFDPNSNCTLTTYDHNCMSHNCSGRGVCAGGNVCRDCDWHPNGGFSGSRCEVVYTNTPCVNGIPSVVSGVGIICSCRASWYGTSCNESACPSPGGAVCSGKGSCTGNFTCNSTECSLALGLGCDCGINATSSCGPSALCSGKGVCTIKYDANPWRGQYASCDCVPGYTGTFCELDINECASNPCFNGASCQNNINNFVCTCVPGFSGTLCQTNIEECASVPCQNGAICNDLVNGYTCTCVAGFTGVACATNVNECSSSPCANGATCFDLTNGFVCTCVPGFTGILCETDVNECASNPCFNGASCHNNINSFSCQPCVSGYTGTLCETNIQECASNPCQNGGTCVDLLNRYTCTCAPGLTGIRCTININECSSNPCANSGTCTDMIAGYVCTCAPGYTGTQCLADIAECASSPCENGGTCIDLVAGYTCACAPGFGGLFCNAFGEVFVPPSANTHVCDRFTPRECSPMVTSINATRYLGGFALDARCQCRNEFYGPQCNKTTRDCGLTELKRFCDPIFGSSCKMECAWNNYTACQHVTGSCRNTTTRQCSQNETRATCGPLGIGCIYTLGSAQPLSASTCDCGNNVLDTLLRYSAFPCTSRHLSTGACPAPRNPTHYNFTDQCGTADVLGCIMQVVWLNDTQMATAANVVVPSNVDNNTVDYQLATFYSSQTLFVWSAEYDQYHVGPFFQGSTPVLYPKCSCISDPNTFAATHLTVTRAGFSPARHAYSSAAILYTFCDNTRVETIARTGLWRAGSRAWSAVCGGIGLRRTTPQYAVSTIGATGIIKSTVEEFLRVSVINVDSYVSRRGDFAKTRPPRSEWASTRNMSNYATYSTGPYFPWWFNRLRATITQGGSSTSVCSIGQVDLNTRTIPTTTGTWPTSSVPYLNKNVMVTIHSATKPGCFMYADPTNLVPVLGCPGVSTTLGPWYIWAIYADGRDLGNWMRITSMGLRLCRDPSSGSSVIGYQCTSDQWRVRALDESVHPYIPLKSEVLRDQYKATIMSYTANTFLCTTSLGQFFYSSYVDEECVWIFNQVVTANLTHNLVSSFSNGMWWWHNDRLIELGSTASASTNLGGDYSFTLAPADDNPESVGFHIVGIYERILRAGISGNAEMYPHPPATQSDVFNLTDGRFSCNVQQFGIPEIARCLTNIKLQRLVSHSTGAFLKSVTGAGKVQYSLDVSGTFTVLMARPGARMQFDLTEHGGLDVNSFYPTKVISHIPNSLSCPNDGRVLVNGASNNIALNYYGDVYSPGFECVCPSFAIDVECNVFDATKITNRHVPGISTLFPEGSVQSNNCSTLAYSSLVGGLYCTVATQSLMSKAGCVHGVYNFSASACICDKGWQVDPIQYTCTVVDVRNSSDCGGRDCHWNGGACHATLFGQCNCTSSNLDPTANCRMSSFDSWCGSHNCSGRGTCVGNNTCDDCEWHPNGGFKGNNCSQPFLNTSCVHGSPTFHPSVGIYCQCDPTWFGASCNQSGCPSPGGVPCSGRGSCNSDLTCNGSECQVAGGIGCDCGTSTAVSCGSNCNGRGNCTAKYLSSNDYSQYVSCDCIVGFNSSTNCAIGADECASTPCLNGAGCFDGNAGYTCVCASGYTGTFCQTNVDECASSPCQNGGDCTDMINGFSCQCLPGYQGILCANDVDECASSPCQNGGNCTNGLASYNCTCPGEYTGTRCHLLICDQLYCANGATCYSDWLGGHCLCRPGYTGAACETDTDECRSSPCRHAHECIDQLNGYFCNCSYGFNGVHCEYFNNNCASVPCRNFGECVDSQQGNYTCICNPGYLGDYCEIDIDECASSPCQNEGKCRDQENGFYCFCPLGTYGDRCEIDIDECDPSPCQGENSRCIDRIGGYTCLCESLRRGIDCEEQIDPCSFVQCLGNRQCVRGHCECVPGWQGSHCDLDINECVIGTSNCSRGECVNTDGGFLCVATSVATSSTLNSLQTGMVVIASILAVAVCATVYRWKSRQANIGEL